MSHYSEKPIQQSNSILQIIKYFKTRKPVHLKTIFKIIKCCFWLCYLMICCHQVKLVPILFYSVYVVEGIQTPIACLDTPAWTTRPGDPGGRGD